MMKVVFLDIDGVLNSDSTLYENISLEDNLIMNLKELIDRTGAKIILSSSWRTIPAATQKLMNKLDEFNLHLSGMTSEGVEASFIEAIGFKPTKRFLDDRFGFELSENKEPNKKYKMTFDRGAEIFKWLCDHDDCAYVILDDDMEDIKPYFKSKVLIKTRYETGLTKDDVEKAVKILNGNAN